ncbi:hypothetical protein ACOMHN_064988 [Nucella lapillus]
MLNRRWKRLTQRCLEIQSAMSASPEASGIATEKDTTLLTSQPLMEASNTTVPADVELSMEATPEASGTATERDTTLLASHLALMQEIRQDAKEGQHKSRA